MPDPLPPNSDLQQTVDYIDQRMAEEQEQQQAQENSENNG